MVDFRSLYAKADDNKDKTEDWSDEARQKFDELANRTDDPDSDVADEEDHKAF